MKSTNHLAPVLASLSKAAAGAGLSDAAWARLAGIKKESLSRLRRRNDCDFATLAGLAAAIGCEWQLVPRPSVHVTADGLFPECVDRAFEERLVELAASGNRDPGHWRCAGPAFFMAGLAVLLGGSGRWPRAPMLALADELHAGITEPATFQLWLDHSPLRPARFLPLLEQRHAAF